MQNAKDTFYLTLRNRLAAVNPARTMTLRSVTRPGILVEDAEAFTAQPQLDAFTLRWTGFQADLHLPSILAQMTCEVQYTTAGTQTNAGLDRGRSLARMDYELLQLLYPYSAQKMSYAQNPVAPMGTLVFWSEPEFGSAVSDHDRLTRTAKITVFAFQEPSES
jgi:hypothetical protein